MTLYLFPSPRSESGSIPVMELIRAGRVKIAFGATRTEGPRRITAPSPLANRPADPRGSVNGV